jgi:hypothetical protein
LNLLQNEYTFCRLREEGDEICDRALEEAFPKGSVQSVGVDLLGAIEAQAASNPSGACAGFVNETRNPLPPDIAVGTDVMDAGTEFFVAKSTGILQALMHFSLAGGFARWAQNFCPLMIGMTDCAFQS